MFEHVDYNWQKPWKEVLAQLMTSSHMQVFIHWIMALSNSLQKQSMKIPVYIRTPHRMYLLRSKQFSLYSASILVTCFAHHRWHSQVTCVRAITLHIITFNIWYLSVPKYMSITQLLLCVTQIYMCTNMLL